jgi:hypothetical protein
MKPTRTKMTWRGAASAFVLLLGAGFFVWSLMAPGSGNDRQLVSLAASNKAVDKNLDFVSRSGSLLAGIGGSPNVVNIPPSDNLTERVVQKYGEETLKLNADAATNDTGQIKAPGQSAFDNAFTGSLSQEIPVKLFELKDLRTFETGDKKDIEAYFKTLSDINNKDSKSVSSDFLSAVARTVTEGNFDGLTGHINMATNYINDLLKVRVPKSWGPWHLSFINLLQKRLTLAGTIIASHTDDPVKVAVAIRQLSDTFDEEKIIVSVLDDYRSQKKL